MPPNEIHENIRKFYGLDEKVNSKEEKIVNLADLL